MYIQDFNNMVSFAFRNLGDTQGISTGKMIYQCTEYDQIVETITEQITKAERLNKHSDIIHIVLDEPLADNMNYKHGFFFFYLNDVNDENGVGFRNTGDPVFYTIYYSRDMDTERIVNLNGWRKTCSSLKSDFQFNLGRIDLDEVWLNFIYTDSLEITSEVGELLSLSKELDSSIFEDFKKLYMLRDPLKVTEHYAAFKGLDMTDDCRRIINTIDPDFNSVCELLLLPANIESVQTLDVNTLGL